MPENEEHEFIQPTSLDLLFKNMYEYKKEILEFLGLTSHYIPLNNFNHNYALNDSKWLNNKIDLINNHLLSENASISITKHLNEYPGEALRPIIKLKKLDVTIEFTKGLLVDRFSIYSDKSNFLQLEPQIKASDLISPKKYDEISSFIQTVTAELTQHIYNDEKLLQIPKANHD